MGAKTQKAVRNKGELPGWWMRESKGIQGELQEGEHGFLLLRDKRWVLRRGIILHIHVDREKVPGSLTRVLVNVD